MNFDFENFLLTRLVHPSEDGHITIFTTEVTKQEIISNIQDMIDGARAPINSIRKEGQAPFSNKKKSEFPDAISLLALDKWCGDNNHNMYIISTDNDLTDYCADNSRLSYLSSIDEFIDLLVSDSEHQHSFIVSAFLVHGELLEESIKEEIEDFIL